MVARRGSDALTLELENGTVVWVLSLRDEDARAAPDSGSYSESTGRSTYLRVSTCDARS